MARDFPDDPLEFEEAVQRFRQRVPMTDAEWKALTAAARERALKVTGVAQMDVIATVWQALDDVIAEGESLDDFKKRVEDKLLAEWGGTVANPSARIETIFRTNAVTAYSAGQFDQMNDPVVRRRRPYWLSETTGDQRQSDICKAIGTVVLPADHPWWNTHFAPLHHQCRRRQSSLTEEQARAMGITASPPNVSAAPGFGRKPTRAAWEPETDKYPEPLARALEQRLAADGG